MELKNMCLISNVLMPIEGGKLASSLYWINGVSSRRSLMHYKCTKYTSSKEIIYAKIFNGCSRYNNEIRWSGLADNPENC